MFCAFEGPPKILRLYGKGEVLEKNSTGFADLQSYFPAYKSARSIIKIKVFRVQDACGYAVPVLEFKQERDILDKWAENKGTAGVEAYIRANNATSIDGLEGL